MINKKILRVTISGKSKEVSLTMEEMLEMYDDMFNQFAHQTHRKTSGYRECVEGFNDFKQMAIIKAMEKYKTYDLSKNANFSTILFKALEGLTVDIIRRNEAQSRKCEHQLIYLDAPVGDTDENMNSVIADNKTDICIDEDATKLEKYLIENLTKEEIMFYTIDLKKRVGKASKIYRTCLEHTIDMFTRVIGVIPDKKEDLAKLLGLSRPTLNKKIKLACEKVKALAEEFCLCNMNLAEMPF